jgi:hypothetical protein
MNCHLERTSAPGFFARFVKVLKTRAGSLLSRAPEGTDAQVKEDNHDSGGNQKSSVVGAAKPTGANAPKRRGKNQHRQQEEDARDFKPQDAANAAEGAQKAANSACKSSAGPARSSARSAGFFGGKDRLPGRGGTGRCLCPSGYPFAGNASGNSEPDAQHTPYGLRFHPDYDGSSDAGGEAFFKFSCDSQLPENTDGSKVD